MFIASIKKIKSIKKVQHKTAKRLVIVIYLFICSYHSTFYPRHPNEWVVII